MSKLLVKGGPLGGGTMVLESPDTEDDYTLTLPAKSGTVAVLDAATGSPVMADGTPVLESGSNSDGVWIRWGDGTQMCRNTVAGEKMFGNTYGGIFVFPIAFSSIYFSASFTIVGLLDPSDRDKGYPRRFNSSATESRVGLVSDTAFSTADGEEISATFLGQWK